MIIRNGIVLLSVIFIVLLTYDNNQEALAYTFYADNFSIEGNLPIDAVDNFDDDTLTPWWQVQDGTAIESNGVVSFQSPGDLMEPYVVGDYLILEERSAISTIEPGQFGVTDGAGDFRASSKWNPVIPGENQFFGIQMWSQGDGTDEDISLNIVNFGLNLADAIGTNPGLQVSLFTDYGVQFYQIDEEDVLGSIVLGMAFDDTNDIVFPYFSLDDGDNIQTPFDPVSTNLSDFYGAGWMLESAELSVQPVPEPVTILLFGIGMAGLVGVNKKKFKK